MLRPIAGARPACPKPPRTQYPYADGRSTFHCRPADAKRRVPAWQSRSPFPSDRSLRLRRLRVSRELTRFESIDGSHCRPACAVRRTAHRAERPAAADRPADPGGADDDAGRRSRCHRAHRFRIRVRDLGGRIARRRPPVVLGRAPLRLSGPALPLPDLAVARHLRAADGEHLRALGLLLRRRVEIRSGVRDGRTADGGRPANAPVVVRARVRGQRGAVGRRRDDCRRRVRATDSIRARVDGEP